MIDPHFLRSDAYIPRMIRRKARALSWLIGGDPRDIEQRLWMRVVEGEGRFNPGRACFETFAERVATNEGWSILRSHNAQKRDPRREEFSVNLELKDEEGAMTSLHETISSPFHLEPHRNDMDEDIRTLLVQLDAVERSIVKARLAGTTEADIRQSLGITRRVFDECWTRICEAAERLELHEYLR